MPDVKRKSKWKKLKCNKRKENEVHECMNKLNNSKRLEVELRKDSGKSGEHYDNLSLRMKSNCAKAGHDELVEKLKIKERRVFLFLR